MCRLQCSLCVDNFLGTPTDGHQCYRQMTVEREHCFDPVTQMNCNPTRDPNPLGRHRTVLFAVQPKYLNVDIRIILDVTRGGKQERPRILVSGVNAPLPPEAKKIWKI